MCCFMLPGWAVDRIDRIRRKFLWGKNEGDKAGISLMNWKTVCLPKKLGGMGIIDLRLQNTALLLRWWWRPYEETTALWSLTIRKLRWIGVYANGPNYWAVRGSFFWNQLQKLKQCFLSSTSWFIGDATCISFWQDAWSGPPLRDGRTSRSPSQYVSLRDAIPIIEILAPEHSDKVSNIVLNSEKDHIIWRWEPGGSYSARSYYAKVVGEDKETDRYAESWEYKIPPTVKIFWYLLLKNRLLTHDNMLHRNMHCSLPCALCDNCPVESGLHIFFLCQYVVHVWFLLGRRAGFNLITLGQDLLSTWDSSRNNIKRKGGEWKKKGIVLIICACWETWKQRNGKIFSNRRMQPQMLADKIWQEMELWATNC